MTATRSAATDRGSAAPAPGARRPADGRDYRVIVTYRGTVVGEYKVVDEYKEMSAGPRAGREGSRRSLARSTPKGAPRGELPRFVEPQLATLVGEPPRGEGWLHEMKFDGYRILARVERGRATLLSRNGKDWTRRFASIADAASRLPAAAALLDGEVAVLNSDGTTSFSALQNAGEGEGALVYFAFDLLHHDGHDLRPLALEARKAALVALLRGVKEPLHYSAHVPGSGDRVF